MAMPRPDKIKSADDALNDFKYAGYVEEGYVVSAERIDDAWHDIQPLNGRGKAMAADLKVTIERHGEMHYVHGHVIASFDNYGKLSSLRAFSQDPAQMENPDHKWFEFGEQVDPRQDYDPGF